MLQQLSGPFGQLLLPFFTAFGVVVGGSLVGSIATLVTEGSPILTACRLARDIKLWAVIVAIGGTFPTIRAIEISLIGRQFEELIRQFAILTVSFGGAQLGYWIIVTIVGTEP